jgi:hypothetical protein
MRAVAPLLLLLLAVLHAPTQAQALVPSFVRGLLPSDLLPASTNEPVALLLTGLALLGLSRVGTRTR